MHLICRGVNEAFNSLVSKIYNDDVKVQISPSRVGQVIRIQGPVIITYTHPMERVLFNEARDANCFFHMFEGIWMLAGRNDVKSLAYYNSRMKEFSDNGETFHGAYGYRWARHFGYDQLERIIEELKRIPHSRRCVLQMWDASNAWTRGSGSDNRITDCTPFEDCDDLYVATHGGLDISCNLCALFDIVDDKLNMTVFNRSNDFVWGTTGANVVHFSMLLEYMATRIGVKMGVYNQISNNMHVYTERWEPEKWLEDKNGNYLHLDFNPNQIPDSYLIGGEHFDDELQEFVERHSEDALAGNYKNLFLRDVAQPMCIAFHLHKLRDYKESLISAEKILFNDWRIAATSWLTKRQRNWEKKSDNLS